VFCVFNKLVGHGSCRGDATQALSQWQHPVASSEAWDVLHRAMHPALHLRIHMVNLPAFDVYFFSASILLLAKTIGLDHVMVVIN
jgi:hypothetical protein